MRKSAAAKSRKLAIALTGVGALACLALVNGSASAGATTPSPWVTYGQPVTIESLAAQPVAVQELARLAAATVDQHKNDFVGSFIDANGDVVIAPATALGQVLAAALSGNGEALIRPLGFSINAARDLGDSLRGLSPTLGQSMVMWGAYPQTGGMFVTVRDEPSPADRQVIEDFAAAHLVPLRIEVDPGFPALEELESRPIDPSPYAGGARYGTANGSGSTASLVSKCTAGFGYVKGTTEYMLTAGHCFATNSANDWMWIYSGTDANPVKYQYAGKTCCSTYNTNAVGTVKTGADADYHGDLALVNVSGANRDAGNAIWWGAVDATVKIPVTSRQAPTVGDPLCFSGATSGSDCGTVVQKTNVTITTTANNTLRNGDLATSSHDYDCPQGGDSGSPVIIDHAGAETAARAEGIISAGGSSPASPCVMTFTGVEEAMQAWGGGLYFS